MAGNYLPTEPSASPSRPLRLTVGLLLLWTTTTALSLGLASGLARSRDAAEANLYPDSYRQMLWTQDLLCFLAAPAYGAALAAATTAAYRAALRIRGFPSQPGHWIAVLLGIATLGFFAALVPSRDPSTQRLVATAVIIILAIVSCLAASATREPRRWRAALFTSAGGMCTLVAVWIAGQAAANDAQTPAMVLTLVLPGLAIIVSALLAGAAALIDLVRPPRYDLFHWLGILTLAALVAHPAVALGLYWHH